MRPASLVACRCASLKYAGTVMTALRYRRAEVALGIALELAQDEGRDFRRRVGLVAELDAQHFARREIVGEAEREELELVLNVFDAAAHEAFHAVDGALGSFDEIFARGIADDDLVALVEGDDRGHEVQAVFAGNDDGAVASPCRRPASWWCRDRFR